MSPQQKNSPTQHTYINISNTTPPRMSHTQQRHPANGSTVTPQSPQQPPTSPTTPTSDRHRSTPPVRHSQRFRVTFATTSSPKTNFFDLNLHQRRQTPFRPLSPLHNVAAHSSTFSPNHPTLPTPPYHNSPNAAESLSKFDIPLDQLRTQFY